MLCAITHKAPSLEQHDGKLLCACLRASLASPCVWPPCAMIKVLEICACPMRSIPQ